MLDLSQRAVLVSLGISQWTPRRFDAGATVEIAKAHNAAPGAGRYSKELIRRAATTYATLKGILSEMRTDHYSNTLPWTDTGWRMLPTSNYQSYTDTHRRQKTAYDAALPAFLADYPLLSNQQRAVLGSLWKADDYPTAAQLEKKYSIKLDWNPIPDGSDFRLSLTADELQMLKKNTEDRIQKAVTAAHDDAVRRLYEPLAHMAETLKTKDAIFRDTLITNLRDVCDVLKRLNITDDQNLEKLRQEVEALAAYSPDWLRKSDASRQAAAREADRITQAMQGIYGKPKGDPTK